MQKIQDMLNSLYLHYKRRHFSDDEILDKEGSLRDKMKPGWDPERIGMPTEAGFRTENIESFWRNHLFAAFLYVKQ